MESKVFKYKKLTNPLEQTKNIYKKRNKFEEKELKEFSILFLVMNNLDIFRKNIELISKIDFTDSLLNDFKQKLVSYLLSEKFFGRKKLEIEDFEEKFNSIIKLINNNAPIKIIYKNKNENEIIVIFNEIVEEIKLNSTDLNCGELANAWREVNTQYYDGPNQGNFTPDGKLMIGYICK